MDLGFWRLRRGRMNAEIYEEAIQCNTEEELHEYARKNLNRDFTELEIQALMRVIREQNKGGG
jgi:hypothetical protein